jgi:arginyl-tRNA synthetase
LLEKVGFGVVRATYPGDFGSHIAKALWYIEQKACAPQEASGVSGVGASPPAANVANTDSSLQADWLGTMYQQADATFKGLAPDEQALAKQQIESTLLRIQNKDQPTYDLYLQTRAWSLAQMHEVYRWLDVQFDEWSYESELDESSRRLVKSLLDEGKLVVSQAAVGLDLGALGFALLLKSDQTGLYLTKDLELIRRKFQDPEITHSLVIVDARQKLHFAQLFDAATRLQLAPGGKSYHLPYETVTTQDGRPFSSRGHAGLGIFELKEALENKIMTQYLQAYEEWDQQKKHLVAQQIAKGALKFGFLRVDPNQIIRFIQEDWIRLDGDTGPYLQYTHARCCSLLSKFQEIYIEQPVKTSLGEYEQELFYFLVQAPVLLQEAALSFKTNLWASYLLGLCKLFNRFYKECPIKQAEPHVKLSRLQLVGATRKVLFHGLAVLGIEAPSEM